MNSSLRRNPPAVLLLGTLRLAVVLALLASSLGWAAEPQAPGQDEAPAEAVSLEPSEARTAPGGASGPSVLALLASGLMGEAVLFFPLSLTGAFVGSFSKVPCDDHCDGVTHWREGAAVGGSIGMALGAGAGMLLMGDAQGSQANLLATFSGSILGLTLGLMSMMVIDVAPPFRFLFPPTGALLGSLVGFQLSRTDGFPRRFGLNGTQVILTLVGATLGSAAGIAAMLWVNDSFYYPTPFRLEDKPVRFLLPPAGALLGAWGGYALSKLVAGPSSGRATSEGAQVRILSGVAPLPGGGMISVMGRF